MLIDPTRVILRPGNDRRFLNIDYNDREIGHLKLSTDGQLVEVWAIHYESRPRRTRRRMSSAMGESPIPVAAATDRRRNHS